MASAPKRPRQDSDLRPPAPEAGALSAVLRGVEIAPRGERRFATDRGHGRDECRNRSLDCRWLAHGFTPAEVRRSRTARGRCSFRFVMSHHKRDCRRGVINLNVKRRPTTTSVVGVGVPGWCWTDSCGRMQAAQGQLGTPAEVLGRDSGHGPAWHWPEGRTEHLWAAFLELDTDLVLGDAASDSLSGVARDFP